MKKRKRKRVSVQIHTRKLDRCVAKKRMKQAGMRKINKHGFFANNWRMVAEGGL